MKLPRVVLCLALASIVYGIAGVLLAATGYHPSDVALAIRFAVGLYAVDRLGPD